MENEDVFAFFYESENGDLIERSFRKSQVKIERLSLVFKVRNLGYVWNSHGNKRKKKHNLVQEIYVPFMTFISIIKN